MVKSSQKYQDDIVDVMVTFFREDNPSVKNRRNDTKLLEKFIENLEARDIEKTEDIVFLKSLINGEEV